MSTTNWVLIIYLAYSGGVGTRGDVLATGELTYHTESACNAAGQAVAASLEAQSRRLGVFFTCIERYTQ